MLQLNGSQKEKEKKRFTAEEHKFFCNILIE